MNLRKAFLIVFLSIFVSGVGGALIGLSIGILAPDYYRTVLRQGMDAGFDPVQVGIGLGLTQGIGVGVIAGFIILIVVTWYELQNKTGSELNRTSQSKTKWIIGIALFLITCIVGINIGFSFGVGSEQNREVEWMMDRIAPLFQEDEWNHLVLNRSSRSVHLTGSVPDSDARNRLMNSLMNLLSDEEVSRIMEGVRTNDADLKNTS